ncbi:hypothetical protein BR93DRAFT_236705 [Coniochaeta sp. PMI_546]|nr:hypothetical protein BR93DRAFT_236705 [Coniochaeta sp. PMI_546]
MAGMLLLACENCRKRKVRCSGTPTIACSNCEKQNVPCHFDLNRRRRGPRPKCLNGVGEARRPQQKHPAPTSTTSEPAAVLHRHAARDPGELTEREASFCSGSMGTWKSRLIELFGAQEYRLNSESLVTVDQTLHLILIFCLTVNSQQCPVLSPSAVLLLLENGKITRHLCHAMCAASTRYSQHATSRGFTIGEAFAADAREALASPSPNIDVENARFQQLLSLSVLSLHETSRGNGLQAWYDMTAATAVLSSFRHDVATAQDAQLRSGLDMVASFLRVASVLHSIGQSVHSTTISSMDLSTSLEDTSLLLGASFSPGILVRLSDLMARCIAFSRKDQTKLTPAPWSRDSTYMALKKELDVLYIIHGANRAVDIETLELLQRQELGAGYYILCISMLHVMRMLLDAVFVPIPLVPITNLAHNGDRDSTVSPTSRRLSTPRKSMYFPAAPRVFWCERMAWCARSARAVTLLCQLIMRQPSVILPPFLGYSLFLAGLVFLNQLQMETDSTRLDDCIDYLKTIFTVLNAMGSFFAPARLWVNMLFQVHTLDPMSETEAFAADSCDVFSSFSRRFLRRLDGPREPPYCPLSADDITLAKASPPSAAGPTRVASRWDAPNSSIQIDPTLDQAPQEPLDRYHESPSGNSTSSPDASPKGLLESYRAAIIETVEKMGEEDPENSLEIESNPGFTQNATSKRATQGSRESPPTSGLYHRAMDQNSRTMW